MRVFSTLLWRQQQASLLFSSVLCQTPALRSGLFPPLAGYFNGLNPFCEHRRSLGPGNSSKSSERKSKIKALHTTLMQAATCHIPRQQLLGPFAVHDVFPLHAGPVIVHDLTLRKQNESVGLDVIDSLFAEIRADEDSDVDSDPHVEMVQWRALCHINVRAQGVGDGLLPPLSLHGTRLVKGSAITQRTKLEPSLAIIVQGIAGHIHWDYNATPPSLILYSILPNGNHLKFRVRSLETLHHSTRYLQTLSTIKWLRTNKSNTGGDLPDEIVERYKQQFPRQRAYQEQDNKRKSQVHRSDIRSALVTPISMRSSRSLIHKEVLISREGIKRLLHHMRALKEAGYVREAQPTKCLQPPAVLRPGVETEVPEDHLTTSDQIDEILDELPVEFFLSPSELTVNGTWTCVYAGCGDTLEVKPCDHSQDAYEIGLMMLRQAISRHFWEKHVSKHLSQDSLEKLASYLAHVDS